MDPMILFKQDRARAQEQGDPMAALCTVANVDRQGEAQARTLVLREVNGGLAIFVNTTSPKWPGLQATFAVHTYWPSVQVQYRMRVQPKPVDASVVHDSWLLRPDAPKRMDWFYATNAPQSSAIDSRQQLLAQLASVDLPDPLFAPQQAAGILLAPIELERLDLNQPDGVHERQRFNWINGTWQVETLVP